MGLVQTPAAASPEKLQSKTQSRSAETHLSLTPCPAVPQLPGVTEGHRPKDTALQIC